MSDPRTLLHGPANVLSFYCDAVKENFMQAQPIDPTWCLHEAELLEASAQALLQTAEQLRLRAISLTQPTLPNFHHSKEYAC